MEEETKDKQSNISIGWKIGVGLVLLIGAVFTIYMQIETVKEESYKKGLNDGESKVLYDTIFKSHPNFGTDDKKRPSPQPPIAVNSTNASQIVIQNTNAKADLDFYKETVDDLSNKYQFILELYHLELKKNKYLQSQIADIEIELDYAKRVTDQLFLEKDPIKVEVFKKELDRVFAKIDTSLNELAPSQWNDYQPKKADTIITIVEVADDEKSGDNAIEIARSYYETLKYDPDKYVAVFKNKTKKDNIEKTLQVYNRALNHYKKAGVQSKIMATENEITKFKSDFSKYLKE